MRYVLDYKAWLSLAHFFCLATCVVLNAACLAMHKKTLYARLAGSQRSGESLPSEGTWDEDLFRASEDLGFRV